MYSFAVYYIEANVVCMIIFGILLIHNHFNIDRFKTINDTYGHAEGDKALVAVAEALKNVANNHSLPTFLSRYGGDEFILILHPVRIEEVDAILGEIRAEVGKYRAPYELSISAGYDELMGEQDQIRNCIERADKKLYLDKEYRKLQPTP